MQGSRRAARLFLPGVPWLAHIQAQGQVVAAERQVGRPAEGRLEPAQRVGKAGPDPPGKDINSRREVIWAFTGE